MIVPTFNRRQVLAKALQSVVRQTFTDWELIVVDDGSTDDTEVFFHDWLRAQSLTQRVYYINIANGGVSRARNHGVHASTAPWLAFLDSDDEWLSDKLERQLELTSQFQFIHGEEIWIRKGVRVNPMKKHAKSGGRIFNRCVDVCCVSPSTVMLHRDLYAQMNGFREDFPVCEDYELWLRISARQELGFINSPLILKYGGHPDQLSLQAKHMDFFRVKALQPFLTNQRDLSPEERAHVAQTILTKTTILLNGMAKHENLRDQDQVQSWRDEASSILAQLHKTHSAAERLPRSELTLVL